ncbi:MAG: hypothetical protein HYY24_15090 [Verrucomicrobia bacterium]|nr:hypothetical protein [Verrucomicrobiota bacterium]
MNQPSSTFQPSSLPTALPAGSPPGTSTKNQSPISNLGRSTSNPYLFQGTRYDAETGFYYLRNRSFDPAAGRFLQRDPVWDEQNVGGWYTFVGNAPSSRIDPFGLGDGEDASAPQPGGATQGPRTNAGRTSEASQPPSPAANEASTRGRSLAGNPNDEMEKLTEAKRSVEAELARMQRYTSRAEEEIQRIGRELRELSTRREQIWTVLEKCNPDKPLAGPDPPPDRGWFGYSKEEWERYEMKRKEFEDLAKEYSELGHQIQMKGSAQVRTASEQKEYLERLSHLHAQAREIRLKMERIRTTLRQEARNRIVLENLKSLRWHPMGPEFLPPETASDKTACPPR